MGAPETTEGINSWEFRTKHVQDNLVANDFVSAKSVLIAAGPPRKEDIGQNFNSLYPIGVVDNIAIAQNKGLQTIFEIGSDQRYFLPGRTINQVNLGRILFYGPSLLRVLYAYYPPESIGLGSAAQPIANVGQEGVYLKDDNRTPQVRLAPGSAGGGQGANNTDFWLNLASDVFDHPLGLMLWFESGDGKPYGACYLAETYVQAHQFTVNANNVIVAEGISAQFAQIVPIDMKGSFVAPAQRIKIPWPFG